MDVISPGGMNMFLDRNHPVLPPQASPAGAVLTATDLHFHYASSQPAVEGVSVPFYAGEVTMIVGPNGSGKSTLLQLLCGHLTPSGGTVTVRGENITRLHPLKRACLISYVPQAPQVSFAYRVRDIVAMGSWAQQRRQPGEEKVSEDKPGVDRVVQAMWDTDIHALALRTYDELSAGERQRVAIARALVQDAPIMLLDEPTAALDIWHQLELLHHLKSLAQVRHKAVIWVTHDLNHARAHADRVLIMDAGKLAAHGKADQVLTPEILEPIYRVHVTVRDGNLVFSRSAAS